MDVILIAKADKKRPMFSDQNVFINLFDAGCTGQDHGIVIDYTCPRHAGRAPLSGKTAITA